MDKAIFVATILGAVAFIASALVERYTTRIVPDLIYNWSAVVTVFGGVLSAVVALIP